MRKELIRGVSVNNTHHLSHALFRLTFCSAVVSGPLSCPTHPSATNNLSFGIRWEGISNDNVGRKKDLLPNNQRGIFVSNTDRGELHISCKSARHMVQGEHVLGSILGRPKWEQTIAMHPFSLSQRLPMHMRNSFNDFLNQQNLASYLPFEKVSQFIAKEITFTPTQISSSSGHRIPSPLTSNCLRQSKSLSTSHRFLQLHRFTVHLR